MTIDSPPFVSIGSANHDTELQPLSEIVELSSPPISSSSSTYFAEPGKGPSMLGKIWSVAATASNYAIGYISSSPLDAQAIEEEKILRDMTERLQNPGRMLTNIDITLFFQGLSFKTKSEPIKQFSYILDFVLSPISNFSLDAAKQRMLSKKVHDTIVLPFILSGIGMLESNHITVMLIKDKTVSYYDSKGVTSENRLIEGGTLRKLIEFCRDHWSPDALIYENPETVQWDINTCGLHVAHYVYTRIWEQYPLNAPVNVYDVQQFRQTFLEIALLGTTSY